MEWYNINKRNFLIDVMQNLRAGIVDQEVRVLPLQTWGPEFKPQYCFTKKKEFQFLIWNIETTLC
jgi:hypothetical protein